MSILNIYVGRSGIERVTATVRTISESSLAAEVMQAVALPVRLLSDTARDHFAGKTATQDAPGADPVDELDMYVCACGSRFHSAGEAVDHVEVDHASPRIREDLDKLENTIETMITPCPLAPWSDDTLPTRTFVKELHDEISGELAQYHEDHYFRAERLITRMGWDKMKALTYIDLKKQIVLKESSSTTKVNRGMHQDFLRAFALLLRQVGGVLKD